jgi:hypothetical protein
MNLFHRFLTLGTIPYLKAYEVSVNIIMESGGNININAKTSNAKRMRLTAEESCSIKGRIAYLTVNRVADGKARMIGIRKYFALILLCSI